MTTLEQLLDKHSEIFRQCQDIVIQRGKEYAIDSDTLKTFREVGEEMHIPPSHVALILLSIKHKRIVEQMKKFQDPIDSIHDSINYAIYFKVLWDEEKVTLNKKIDS